MRIIGSIDHSSLKITVFKTGERLTLKLENPLYEQSYKLGSDSPIETLEDVKKLADAAFLAKAQAVFESMHQNRLDALGRSFLQKDEEEFDEII